MNRLNVYFFVLLSISFQTFGQHVAASITETTHKGISIKYLDSIYKSAVFPSDTVRAVFKTEEQEEAMHSAYVELLQDLGVFLTAHDFEWGSARLCFNRIYFAPDGSIDYFLYEFKGDNKPSEEKQKEFSQLLNLFIQNYKIPIEADQKFAQCSPVRYMPKTIEGDNQE